jgi:putative oxidoreductase
MPEDLAKLLLRLGLGGLLLFHGAHDLLNDLGPIKAVLATYNISGAVAYAVYLGELIAPVLVIVGLFSRIASVVIVLYVVIALLLPKLAGVAAVSPSGGYALETEAFFLVMALAVALLGAGRLSLGDGNWN